MGQYSRMAAVIIPFLITGAWNRRTGVSLYCVARLSLARGLHQIYKEMNRWNTANALYTLLLLIVSYCSQIKLIKMRIVGPAGIANDGCTQGTFHRSFSMAGFAPRS